MKISHFHTRPPRVEMLPLIDIVFLLLVVFIYTMLSMAVHRGLPVNLPAGPFLCLRWAAHVVTVSKSCRGKSGSLSGRLNHLIQCVRECSGACRKEISCRRAVRN